MEIDWNIFNEAWAWVVATFVAIIAMVRGSFQQLPVTQRVVLTVGAVAATVVLLMLLSALF